MKEYIPSIIAIIAIITLIWNGVRIDIWTHFMRECIINYVH